MLDVAQVFVPVIKSSSVAGYRKGMKITAAGEDITHRHRQCRLVTWVSPVGRP